MRLCYDPSRSLTTYLEKVHVNSKVMPSISGVTRINKTRNYNTLRHSVVTLLMTLEGVGFGTRADTILLLTGPDLAAGYPRFRDNMTDNKYEHQIWGSKNRAYSVLVGYN